MSWAGGAGNLYSTAADLLKWNLSLFDELILSKTSLTKAHTPITLNDGSDFSYGYGVSLGDYKELQRIGHSGGLNGFLSYLVYYPELDASVVVLSNCSPPKNVVPASFAEKLTDIFFDEHLVQNTEIKMDTSRFKKYVGRYIYPGGAVMKIWLDNDHLMAQLTGQNGFEIFPKAEDHFFWKIVDAEIKFFFNEQDEVTYAIHNQGGMEIKAPVMESRKEVMLPKGSFEAYVGNYLFNKVDVKVWEADDRYYLQVAGQPAFELFAESTEAFFTKDLNAQIRFLKVDNKVEGFVLTQAGKEIKAMRK